MTRKIHMGASGLENPDADLPCGSKDYLALLPEPVHWGGCKECARRIKKVLAARIPSPEPPAEPEQIEFDWAPGAKRFLG